MVIFGGYLQVCKCALVEFSEFMVELNTWEIGNGRTALLIFGVWS